MNLARQYYEQVLSLMRNSKQVDFYKWVLANGKEFRGRGMTKREIAKFEKLAPRRLFKKGLCTIQSQMLAMDGYAYYEGIATNKNLEGFPFDHAWNVDSEGRVCDVVWDTCSWTRLIRKKRHIPPLRGQKCQKIKKLLKQASNNRENSGIKFAMKPSIGAQLSTKCSPKFWKSTTRRWHNEPLH